MPWSFSSLERRELLAADAAVTVVPATTSGEVSSSVQTTFGDRSTTIGAHDLADSSGRHLVVVDHEINADDFRGAAVAGDAELIVLIDGRDPIEQLSEILAGRSGVRSLHVISHGKAGVLRLAGQDVTERTLQNRSDEIRAWQSVFTDDADVLLYACELSNSSRGLSFIQTLADLARVDVAASDDRSGASGQADWDLEDRVGAVQFDRLMDPSLLTDFEGQLGIEIWAAGQTSDELMELQIGDQVVDTWFVRDTNAATGDFLPYDYNVDGISADDVRINFVNDFYDPTNGIDRNLRIDKVVIDGITFEAESPWVYSSGVFVDGLGITEGNLNTEYLAANGYMQFRSGGAETGEGTPGGGANGSTIEINAAGETGDEAMQLLIDGIVVQNYFNVPTSGATYTFNADQAVTADRVRVAFIGDVYQPEIGYDQNLRVDNIRIDGQVFESEAASTFSTGSFVSGQGIVPGNWRTELLASNGFFQYGGGGNSVGGNPGSFSLVTSEVTALENSGRVTLEIQRIGGSDGTATVEIFTADESATAGRDYVSKSGTLVFGDGETTKFFTVDLIDDGTAEGTEQFSVRLNNPNGANLLAPRTSLISILDNDSGLPTYADFSSLAGLTLNGTATQFGDDLQLTSLDPRQAGTAFFSTPLPINDSTSFRTSFTIEMGGLVPQHFADGMAFVIQSSPQGSRALGLNAGNLGYGTITNSVAIEFDTYQNTFDSTSNTIGVLANGDAFNVITEVVAPFDLNNRDVYRVWVDYNGQSDVLAVFISQNDTKPDLAILKTQLDLSSFVGPNAYFGFSAGSFDNPNYHHVGSWSLNFDVPPTDPPVNPTGNIVSTDLIGGLNQPLAIEWSPDGRNLYIAEKAGVIKVVRDGFSNPSVVLDISAEVNDIQDRGLIDFALHPDFQSNGYMYLFYTYDPPEVYSYVGNANAGPDGSGNRAGRLIRVQADASTGFTTIVPGSQRILLGNNSTWQNFNGLIDSTVDLNAPPAGFIPGQGYITDFINSDSRSHTVGGLAFAPDGMLYVSIGDGASFNQTDGRALRVQDPDSLSGKVLRIDPITGQGLSDNPFYNGDPDANRSKVYQLGLRNPWRLTVDDATGQLFIGETGLSSFEEINTGGPGANFGWPFYEGTVGGNVRTPGYQNLPQAAGFYASGQGIPPELVLTHQGGSNVVVLGDVLRNTDLGLRYEGDLIYNDMFRGIVGHADIGPGGSLSNFQTFTTDGQFIVDMRQGVDGALYYANLFAGTVGKWELV